MKRKKIILIAILSIILIGIATVCVCNIFVSGYRDKTYSDVQELPTVYAALLLGTSKKLGNGNINTFYKNRIEAAHNVYMAGKCKKIVVSGDNRRHDYNEPNDMMTDLIAMGVKPEDIICDFAGRRTLDSVVRFKEIFGQDSGIVISQEFHNARAIYVASNSGMNLVGYNAKDVDAYNGFKTKIRELASKTICVFDVKVFRTKPRFLGEKIKI